jgi:hypothetical protein
MKKNPFRIFTLSFSHLLTNVKNAFMDALLLLPPEGSNRLSLSNLFTLGKLNGVESMKKMSN